MIRDRSKEISMGITFAIVISLIMLASDGVEFEEGFSGYVVSDFDENVDAIEFTVYAEDEIFYYKFLEDGWYESRDRSEWERRDYMGEDLWKGLYYLRSYDAVIYFDGERVDDITDLTRKLG